jgi:hypothetical protein
VLRLKVRRVEGGEEGDGQQGERLRGLRGAGCSTGEHGRPAGGVHGEVAHAERGGRGDRALDRLGDVVELEVEEDVEAELFAEAHGRGALADEELEADLEHADVRRESSCGDARLGQGAVVERKHQPLSG